MPASEEGDGAAALQQAAFASAEQELWRQHAEYEGGVRVLTWGGLGRTSVVWCPRHGVIYQASVPAQRRSCWWWHAIELPMQLSE